jgi:hypothetical protein
MCMKRVACCLSCTLKQGGHSSHEHTIAWEKIIRTNVAGIKASLSGAYSDTTLRRNVRKSRIMSGITGRERNSGPVESQKRRENQPDS